MSRSVKKPVYNDSGWMKRGYWKAVRTATKTRVRGLLLTDDLDEAVQQIPDPRTVVNDWDYRDYTIDARKYPDIPDIDKDRYEIKRKLSRK